jgi:hypothetical protein
MNDNRKCIQSERLGICAFESDRSRVSNIVLARWEKVSNRSTRSQYRGRQPDLREHCLSANTDSVGYIGFVALSSLPSNTRSHAAVRGR